MSCRRWAETTNYNIHDLENFYGMSFQLSNAQGYQEFTALFDMYKINAIVVKFRWDRQAVPVGTAGDTSPVLKWVVDYNDELVPATVASMQEYQSYRSKQMTQGRDINIKIRPAFASVAYAGIGQVGFQARRGWLATADSGVKHYGFKWCVDGSAAGGTGDEDLGNLTREVIYYMSFKTTK